LQGGGKRLWLGKHRISDGANESTDPYLLTLEVPTVECSSVKYVHRFDKRHKHVYAILVR